MRHASQIVAEILEALAAAVRPGITTEELDKLAEDLTYKKGAKPAFKGYKPGDVVYPKCLCVSINNEIVHGIPSSRKLKAGDIVSLDFGVVYEGFYGDSARTVAVGPVPERVTQAAECNPRLLVRGNRAGSRRKSHQRYRACGAGYRRAGRVFGRDRLCRTRHRPPPP